MPKNKDKCDKCGGDLVTRADDKEEVILERFKKYDELTNPILNILVNK